LRVLTTGCDSYRWQVSENDGQTFSDIVANEIYSNESSSDLTITGATWADEQIQI
jgi:hypothetical protein